MRNAATSEIQRKNLSYLLAPLSVSVIYLQADMQGQLTSMLSCHSQHDAPRDKNSGSYSNPQFLKSVMVARAAGWIVFLFKADLNPTPTFPHFFAQLRKVPRPNTSRAIPRMTSRCVLKQSFEH
jgi:hypothetical protein